MKYILYIIKTLLLLCMVFLLFACGDSEKEGSESTSRELVLYSAIDPEAEGTPRGIANTFFVDGDQIRVTLESSYAGATEEEYIYTYGSDGIFQGNPPYRFPLDDSHIKTLTAVWPTEATALGIFISDQREFENHRKSDWLVATATTYGIMPTNIPVPLHFERKNYLLEFELAGQNVDGLTITELLLELEVDGEPVACWAYCGNENGRASLLLKDGTMIASKEGYLLGTIPGLSDDRYTIILPEISMTLEAGKRYLVTLTPRGYDLDMYVLIGTFAEANGETETGIGIPFHKPTETEEGDYIIHTPVQLITMSYLMRHYYNGTTIAWPTLTYTIADDFVMATEYAALYIPVNYDDFSEQIIYQGEPIESITYDGDQVLELFIRN